LRVLPSLSSSNISWSTSAKKKRIIIEADYSMGKRTQKINARRRSMYVEQWSHEEIVTYCNNANLLFSKANELRSRVIRELFVRFIRRMTSLLKYQGR
jgi:hypothetical protein